MPRFFGQEPFGFPDKRCHLAFSSAEAQQSLQATQPLWLRKASTQFDYGACVRLGMDVGKQ
jgi:hypothetical protein